MLRRAAPLHRHTPGACLRYGRRVARTHVRAPLLAAESAGAPHDGMVSYAPRLPAQTS